MKEKIKKYIWIIIIVILIAIYYWHYYLPYKKAYEKCLEYVLYSPERQAYRWKFEFVDEWYKTHEDAMKACINVQKEIYR